MPIEELSQVMMDCTAFCCSFQARGSGMAATFSQESSAGMVVDEVSAFQMDDDNEESAAQDKR